MNSSKSHLNNKLLEFNNQTSTQIYVVTYDDLQGFHIGDFADRLGEKWGIGQKGKDNGILILVSPENRKGLPSRRVMDLKELFRMPLPSGLIEKVITPGFQARNYYAGLDSATNVLMSLTRGEFTADDYMKKSGEEIPGIIFGLIVLFIFIFILASGRRKNRGLFPASFHTLVVAVGSRSLRNSGWGIFFFRRWHLWWRRRRFGGFGGGGGGSFGGGGASGGW